MRSLHNFGVCTERFEEVSSLLNFGVGTERFEEDHIGFNVMEVEMVEIIPGSICYLWR